MQLLRNFFLVTADADAGQILPIKGLNGEFLTLDTKFDPMRHATRVGRIACVPVVFDSTCIDSNTLKVKDKVLFHHFVCHDDNKWIIDGKTYYRAIWEHVWAKIEFDKLVPINDWLFVDPTESTIFALSNYCKSLGLSEGDKVKFLPNADYELKIGDKIYWRMKVSSIVVIEKDGEVHPLVGQFLIEQDEQDDRVVKNGLLLPESMRSKTFTGTIVSGVFKGDKVTYFRGMYGNFDFNGKNYSVLTHKQIVCTNQQ